MKLWGWVLYFVPKNILSFLVGVIVSLPLPEGLRLTSMKWFAKRYKINMDEAEKPLEAYKSINDLFTRKLKAGIRPISNDSLVHPADSEVTVAEKIVSSQFVQAKGKSYSIEGILGAKGDRLKSFESGYHITYYLCPTDYHRVHSPVGGAITGFYYQPGRLWPVNPWSVESISQLFAVNERVTIWINDEKGREVALTLVGATNVGKMTLSFEPEVITNQSHFRKPIKKTYSQPIPIAKGDELGIFNMGSTVLLFLPKDYIESVPFSLPNKVKFGESFYQSGKKAN